MNGWRVILAGVACAVAVGVSASVLLHRAFSDDPLGWAAGLTIAGGVHLFAVVLVTLQGETIIEDAVKGVILVVLALALLWLDAAVAHSAAVAILVAAPLGIACSQLARSLAGR